MLRILTLLTLLWPIVVFGQASICGDPPPVADEQLKGELQGKAQALSKWLGDFSLSGEIQTSRKEIFSKYPNADAVRSDAYFEYQVCVLIMTDDSLSNIQKLEELKKVRREFKKSSKRQESGKEEEKWVLMGQEELKTDAWANWPKYNVSTERFSLVHVSPFQGKYRVKIIAKKKGMRQLDSPYGAAIEFRVSVNINMVSFNSRKTFAGLLFGRAQGVEYQFSILSRGSWALTKSHDDGSNDVVLGWTKLSDFSKGKVHRLEVVVDDRRIQLFFDSKFVGEFDDPDFKGGTVGVFVGSDEGGNAEVWFREFKFYRREAA